MAATVFLEGSESPSGHSPAHVDIARRAVDRVVAALERCDADAVSAIVRAARHYRRDQSWHRREAVIEAVTVAVVPAVGR